MGRTLADPLRAEAATPAMAVVECSQIVNSRRQIRNLAELAAPFSAASSPLGDPYGNRTRVSAVKGPRPNR